jgi:hypothetical protein
VGHPQRVMHLSGTGRGVLYKLDPDEQAAFRKAMDRPLFPVVYLT